jgi:hypothetical protein
LTVPPERLDDFRDLLPLPEQRVGLAQLGDGLLGPETLARHGSLSPSPDLDRP